MGDLSADISNIGPFFAANDMGERFPILYQVAVKK